MLVADALDEIPPELAQLIDNCVIMVEEFPPPDEPDLLGLVRRHSADRAGRDVRRRPAGSHPDLPSARSWPSARPRTTSSRRSTSPSCTRWRTTSASTTIGCTNWATAEAPSAHEHVAEGGHAAPGPPGSPRAAWRGRRVSVSPTDSTRELPAGRRPHRGDQREHGKHADQHAHSAGRPRPASRTTTSRAASPVRAVRCHANRVRSGWRPASAVLTPADQDQPGQCHQHQNGRDEGNGRGRG